MKIARRKGYNADAWILAENMGIARDSVAARKLIGLTQRDTAALLLISPRSMQRMEAGHGCPAWVERRLAELVASAPSFGRCEICGCLLWPLGRACPCCGEPGAATTPKGRI